MSNAVFFNAYKLKKGSSPPDFLSAVEKLSEEIESKYKHKGYISFQLLVDGETWADFSMWETMEGLDAFITSSREASANGTNETAENFYSFLNFNRYFKARGSYSFIKPGSLRSHLFSVVNNKN